MNRNQKRSAVILWLLVAAGAVGLGLVFFYRNQPRVIGGGNGSAPAGRELVRSWLRENLDSGKWEEVRWWEPKRLKGYWLETIQEAEFQLKTAQDRMAEDPSQKNQDSVSDSRQYLAEVMSRKDPVGIRLKYRTASQTGAMELMDHMFLLEDSGVRVLKYFDKSGD